MILLLVENKDPHFGHLKNNASPMFGMNCKTPRSYELVPVAYLCDGDSGL
jgi:hypothetical protein